jgi:hypothetical protein
MFDAIFVASPVASPTFALVDLRQRSVPK